MSKGRELNMSKELELKLLNNQKLTMVKENIMAKYKYFIFSDIHGCYDAFITGLTNAGFDIKNKQHILVGAGDYFDRGTQNTQIYNFLTSKKLKGRVYLIRGNHDDMLLSFLLGEGNGFFNCHYNGMLNTLESFSNITVGFVTLQLTPEHYVQLINKNFPKLTEWLKETLKQGYQIDKYKITHAGLRNIVTGSENEPEWIIDNWAPTPNFIADYPEDGFIHVFGHWHARQLREQFGYESCDEAFIYKHFVGLDACTNLSKFVNIFVIESDQLPIELKEKS